MVGGKTPGPRRLGHWATAAVLAASGTLACAGEVHVPAEPLAQSLKDIAHQTGVNVLFAPETVRDRLAAAVNGKMSAIDAISSAIAGSGLEVVSDGIGGLIVRPLAPAVRPTEPEAPEALPETPRAATVREPETIIVTGIRGSLERNLSIKRSAVGLIDAITHEDTGRFPDANLATALMRVPGVTVNRAVTSLSGINSSTGEPTEITVRGFGPTFNETLFEGRKIPSGVSNRAFDFSALNSDLVQEVDILKSPDPSLSAGAIGATINVIYPKPLDTPGRRLVASASTTYTPETGHFTPNGNVLISDTFAGGRFGVLVAGAYAETKSRSNEASVWGWEGTYLDPCQFAGATQTCGPTPNPDTSRPVWYIQDYGVYQIRNWQMRENALAVLQWQPSDRVQATVNANFTRNDLKERQNGYAIWNNASEMRHVTTSKDGTITGFVRPNTPTDFDAQINEQVLQSYDIGANLRIQPDDHFTILADVDLALSSLNPGGQLGEYSANIGYGPSTPTGINGSDIGISVAAGGNHVLPYYTAYGPHGDADRFLDPSLLGSHVVVMIGQRNRYLVNQAKLEVSWEDEPLRIAAGFHHLSNHMTLANYQDFANNHWQAFSGYGPASHNTYSTGGAAGLPAGVSLPANLFTASFSTANFISGWHGADALPARILSFDPVAVISHIESLGDPVTPTTIPGFNWGCCSPAYRGKFSLAFDPANYQRIHEDNFAGYLVVTGRSTVKGLSLRYHAGLRAESTDVTSDGIQRLPTALSVMPSDHTAFQVSYDYEKPVSNHRSYYYILPNIDLTLELSDAVDVRLSASRTLTRPPLNYLTPIMNLTASERVGSLVATGGNSDLEPYLSDNVDLATDWYYAPNSYISINSFFKNVTNFIVSSAKAQTINNVIDPTTGAPAIFRISSYINGPTAHVYGLEVALQHVFGDTGFGFQVNGTLVGSNKPYDPHDLTTSGFAVTGLADSANLIAFYDKGGFEIRIAANWRDSYLDHFGQQQNYSAFGAEPTFVDTSWNIDMSTSYALSDNIDVYCEVMNVLNSTYSTRGRFAEQVLDVVDYGRRITVGLHYRM
ncbi:TonB-dependent receptor [Rhizomicrobium electricum]|uniref:TonB-dependent receptor n=1 Tax=Rhizomicrobium electricum TaxID=480070 RepID=A0ABN1EUX5_9PROT|nr:TonB-dependent receptor [Rhizomicrobium electricum]NIJ49623.1 TonB-dependent receptor [Rhizomicrobium electricum]